jgi:hypothetical protein
MPYSFSAEIKSYVYKIFPQKDAPGNIGLYDINNNNFGHAFMRPDNENIPKAYIDEGGKYRMYFHRKYFAEVLDMLRNEKPVYFHYWEGPGDNSHLSTMLEPVGENE